MSTTVYTLNSGKSTEEGNRLDYQHKALWKPLTENKLLPSNISDYLNSLSAPKVADIGSGTGIWLEELAETLPSSAVLNGFDLDASKFHPEESRPANITFSFANIIEPFPAHLQGQYDLAHVRLFLYALKAEDWVPAMQNLASLLRPGGYLFWEDSGHGTWFTIPPSRPLNQFIEIDTRAGKAMGRDLLLPYNLIDHAKKAGWVDLQEKFWNSLRSPELKQSTQGSLVLLASQALTGLVKRGGVEGARTAEEVKTLVEDIDRDTKDKIANATMVWVWGRKF